VISREVESGLRLGGSSLSVSQQRVTLGNVISLLLACSLAAGSLSHPVLHLTFQTA
jgi:hypothetical protein